MKRRLLLTGILLSLSLTNAYTPNAYAANTDYIYCELTDSSHSIEYFSDVFLGDYSLSTRYSNAFTDHVHGESSAVTGIARCFFATSASDARAKKDNMRSSGQRIYKKLVETRWSY